MKKLLASLAAVAGIYANAAENTETNLISHQNTIAAVLTTATPKKVAAAPKAKPSPRFAHSVSRSRAASTSETKGAKMAAQTTATNTLPSAVGPLPRAKREPRYELVPMTTEALAERRAIIGWEIRLKKRAQ